MPIQNMVDLDLYRKRVLIREDLNVPLNAAGNITSDARIRAALPTLQLALKKGAAVIVLSHLGRPQEGATDTKLSLAPVAKRLSELLAHPVRFAKVYLQGIAIKPGEIVLCENVRFNKGESADDESLAKQLAALGDIFVMDAFATAHRTEASTHALAKVASVTCAGPLLQQELAMLTKVLAQPKRPLLAIVGGSKVSTKLSLLENLIDRVDQLIVGGGIANTFLAAQGYQVGKSLVEPALIALAKTLLQRAAAKGHVLPLPTDVVVANEFSAQANATVKPIAELMPSDMILDIGPATVQYYTQLIAKAGTIIWNGPVGVFEFEAFSQGTAAIGRAIAASQALSLAGGGDTVAAVDKYQLADKISYISTAGGAFLAFLEGKTLPAIAALDRA